MLTLNFLSLNLFGPVFPIPLHKQWPDSSTQALAIYSKAICEMFCPEEDNMSSHPFLLPDGLENTYRVLQSQRISEEK